MSRSWLYVCFLISTVAATAVHGQDLRSQCTAQVAGEVLRDIYAPEMRSYPMLAQVFASPSSAPVMAAVNDCQAGREGGGRAGMDRWIRQAQNRQWYWQNLVSPALVQAQAQDVRGQCTPQVANEVLSDIFSPEIRSYPVLAQLFASPGSGPVRAAVNDCQAGREGGGRAGMDRWIRQAQNRQWYWQNLVSPELAQAQAQDLRAQCTAPVASEVLRDIFAPEIARQPELGRFLSLPDAGPVRAAVNDCQAGREGGGRAGMARWIGQPQNRLWYWQNLISIPFSQWLASQTRGGGQVTGGQQGGSAGQRPTFPVQPPSMGIHPPRAGAPSLDMKVPLPSVPPRMGNAAAEVRQYAQAAMDLAQAPALRQIPDADEAIEFLGMAGALADLLADPNRLASVGGATETGDDPLDAQWRLALAQAVTEAAAARLEQGKLDRLLAASMDAAWHFQADALVPLASWRERSVALITDDRVSIPEIRNARVRVDWSRFDKAETLFLMIELSSALKTAQQAVRTIGSIADFIEDAVSRVHGLEAMPIPTLQAALKTIAVTAIVSEITSEVIEGSTALMPGRIDEFYVRVNGTDRRPRDPALTIEVGANVPLEVFLTYSTHGGSLSTPWYLLELAVPRLMKHPKVSQAIAAARSRAGAAAANLEREIEARIKGNGYAVLKAELERLYRANQRKLNAQGRKIYAYIQATSPEFPIPVVKRSTDINSDRVLRMQSNSPSLLDVGQSGANQFFLLGKADSKGREAGYHVALKAPLLQRMVMLGDRTHASPNLLGTVIVNDKRNPGNPGPQLRLCANGMGVLDEQGQCWPFR